MSAGRGGEPGEPFDYIVIGAGPAGLSASLFLARYRRRATGITGE